MYEDYKTFKMVRVFGRKPDQLVSVTSAYDAAKFLLEEWPSEEAGQKHVAQYLVDLIMKPWPALRRCIIANAGKKDARLGARFGWHLQLVVIGNERRLWTATKCPKLTSGD